MPVKRPTVWDMIKAVTVNPANRLGRSDLGRIAVGAKADLTSIDVTGFLAGVGATPPEPLNNLLYANGLHVRNVMTEGVLQVRDGHLIVDDERRVMERGGRVAQKIWARLEAGGLVHADPTLSPSPWSPPARAADPRALLAPAGAERRRAREDGKSLRDRADRLEDEAREQVDRLKETRDKLLERFEQVLADIERAIPEARETSPSVRSDGRTGET